MSSSALMPLAERAIGKDLAVEMPECAVDRALDDHVGVDGHNFDFDVAAQLIDDAVLDGLAQARLDQIHGARARARQHDARGAEQRHACRARP